MAKQAASLTLAGPQSRANAAANALINPETSRFTREILEKALTNPLGVAPRWAAEAWGLLANILVNDYLHAWNNAGYQELNEAEDAVYNALALDPELALAYHASGLIHRARGDHQAALDDFDKAVQYDPDFARAHAQKGNELVLLGRPQNGLPCVDQAIQLSPNDPAAGSFHWIKGRAHFFDGDYPAAASSLQQSIALLPTVWYSWLYLVSALALQKGIKNQATALLKQFEAQFGKYTIKQVEELERANPNSIKLVVDGRRNFHNGLKVAGMPEQ